MTPATSERPARRTAADMITDCFRHQHPEAYGRPEVGDVALPRELRYGMEEIILPTSVLPEMPMGYPDARDYDGGAT